MPEFVLEGRDAIEFRELPKFVQGYIEAIFFTEAAGTAFTIENWKSAETQEAVTEGQADGNIPSDCGFLDLHPDALEAIIATCESFQFKAADRLAMAYESGYSEDQAGCDFWFTRNRHGVGYWDRDNLPCAAELTDIAQGFDEAYVWFGDHVEYGDAPFVHYQ